MDMCILRTSLSFFLVPVLVSPSLVPYGWAGREKNSACVRSSSVLISLVVVFALLWAVIIVAFLRYLSFYDLRMCRRDVLGTHPGRPSSDASR